MYSIECTFDSEFGYPTSIYTNFRYGFDGWHKTVISSLEEIRP